MKTNVIMLNHVYFVCELLKLFFLFHRKKNTRKKINDLSARGQRCQRKYWRVKQVECRVRKAQRSIIVTTPRQHRETECNSSNKNMNFSGNKERGRKKVLRNRSKVVKDNMKLKKDNEKLHRQVEKYRKRWQRKNIAKNHVLEGQLTPRTKTTATIKKYFKGKMSRNHPVARQLFLHNVLKQSLQDKYKTVAKKRKKNYSRGNYNQNAKKISPSTSRIIFISWNIKSYH